LRHEPDGYGQERRAYQSVQEDFLAKEDERADEDSYIGYEYRDGTVEVEKALENDCQPCYSSGGYRVRAKEHVDAYGDDEYRDYDVAEFF
jgi:hypothetical protein